MVTQQKLQVILVTGRTIEQGVARESGKFSKEYAQSVSVCFIDPEDLKASGIKENTNVRVSTSSGSVVLTAIESPRKPHRGIIFIPYGPWANMIVDQSTDSIGMPSLKGIPAELEPAPTEHVLSLKELLSREFGVS
jgi:formylmethanofuran dehydrogenase subunit D